MGLGVSVTLRNKIMYEFLDRLINIAIPRIRDFRGLIQKVLMEMVIILLVLKSKLYFQKLIMIKLIKFEVLDITICTTAKNNEEALELLKILICLFRHRETN